jgi:hypothetical protein
MNDPLHREIVARLENWNWPPARQPVRRRLRVASTLLKWAAVVVLAGAGFYIGRTSAPAPDLTAWSTEQEAARRQQIANLTEVFERARRDDRQALLGAIEQIQAQHTSDFLSLRRDLETVAATAEAQLLRTQQGLMFIAAQNPPGNSQ